MKSNPTQIIKWLRTRQQGSSLPNREKAADLIEELQGAVIASQARIAELEQANNRVILDSSTVAVNREALEALRSAMSNLRAPMSRTEYAVARAGIIEAACRLLEGDK